MPDLRHPQRPCSECPWRRDQPLGRFEASRYEELRDTSAGPAGSAPLGAPMFACHKSHEGADLACAGWLAVEGHGHVAVRLAVAQGRLDADALAAGHDWPQLYDSYEQMAAANGASFPESPATRRASSGSVGKQDAFAE